MKRRDFVAAAGILPITVAAGQAVSDDKALGVHPEKGETYEELYWDAQAHIDKLELEVKELKGHFYATKAHLRG